MCLFLIKLHTFAGCKHKKDSQPFHLLARQRAVNANCLPLPSIARSLCSLRSHIQTAVSQSVGTFGQSISHGCHTLSVRACNLKQTRSAQPGVVINDLICGGARGITHTSSTIGRTQWGSEVWKKSNCYGQANKKGESSKPFKIIRFALERYLHGRLRELLMRSKNSKT